MCHCEAKEFGNTCRPRPLLRMFHPKEGAGSLHISIKNRDTQTEKGKFIYKALTLHGKELLKCG